jgi:sugar phosphate isomerase/epimerase
MSLLRNFSLSQLTVLELSPPDVIGIAHRAGYKYVSLRLLPASPDGIAYPLMDDTRLLRETLSLIAGTGVGVLDIEMIRIDSAFDVGSYSAFFEVGTRLGARAILVAGDDDDETRLTASFAALCEAARPFGLSANLEFMPWTQVPDAVSALRVVRNSDQPNGAVLVDALHYARSATSLSDIASIPREMLNYAQICDAPADFPATVEGLLHTARYERLLPGEGNIDLVSLFATLPADLPISIEIPHAARVQVVGVEEWVRLAIISARKIISETDDLRR